MVNVYLFIDTCINVIGLFYPVFVLHDIAE